MAPTVKTLEGKVLRGILDVCYGAAALYRSHCVASLIWKATSSTSLPGFSKNLERVLSRVLGNSSPYDDLQGGFRK